MSANQGTQFYGHPDTQQVLNLVAELEERLGKLKHWQQENEKHLQQVEHEAQVVQQRDVRLSLRNQRLHRLVQALHTRAHMLTAAERNLAQRQTHLAQQQAEFQQQQAKYQQTAQQAATQLAAERAELAQRAKALEKLTRQTQAAIPLANQRADASAAPTLAPTADAEMLARRQKLHHYKALLRERSVALKSAQKRTASTRQQYEGLLQQRQTLIQVKQFLAASEERMVRQWASAHAASLVVGAVIGLALLGLFSYVLGQALTSPLWQASAQIAAPSAAAAQEGRQQWLLKQQDTLLSAPVLAEALNQLNLRGLRPFPSPTELRDHLQTRLTSSTPDGEKLLLTFKDADREGVVAMLECVSRAFVGYQLAEDRKAGKPAGTRILEAAARSSTPLEDHRLTVAGAIFGITTLLAVVLSLLLRGWYLRSLHRIGGDMPQAMSDLEDANHWPAVSARAASETTASTDEF